MSNSTRTIYSSSPSSFPSLPLPNFSHILSVKLPLENYFLGKVQLVPYLRWPTPIQICDGSCPSSPSQLPNNSPNPKYDTWVQHDQLVMSALISTLSKSIIAQVIGCASTCEVWWLSLASTYASTSQAKLMQTKL